MSQGSLIAIVSALCYATGVVFFRFAHAAGVSAGSAAAIRFSVAALLLIPILLLSGQWTRLVFGQTGKWIQAEPISEIQLDLRGGQPMKN
jgi:drug/metabolite transporter (DMT)-like permease